MSGTIDAPEAPTPPDGEAVGRYPGWLGADVDGRPVRFWILVGIAIAAVTLGFGAWWVWGLDRGMGGDSMTGDGMADMAVDAPQVPAVFGFYDGQPIAFIHTEASDPAVAEMLTGMMGSPVPVVESLGSIDPSLLATVVVFTNGLQPQDVPAGPFGFQPDVFDSAPGDPGYTPLRRVMTATWADPGRAELLTSMDQVERAVGAGLLQLEDSGAVINAPFLTWPSGRR